MAGFFNPNTAFDPNNPQDYDYQSQAQKLAMQQALAQRLGQPLDQGKMVSGWYVAPGKGASSASALQQALGGYMQVKGMENQSNLDKSDRDAMIAARKAYADSSDPSNYIDKTLQAVPTPEAQYSYKHPEDVGPPDPRAPQREVPIADQRTTYPSQTTQFPMSLGQGASPVAQMQQANAQPQMSPAPWAPEGATDSPQQVGVAGQREPTFDVTQPSPEEAAAAKASQVKYLQKAMAADRQAALDNMSRTKSGGPLANAIMARDYSPAEWDMQKIKEGDNEVLVAVNKRDPSQMKRVFGGEPTGQLPLKEREFAYKKEQDERDRIAAANKPMTTLDTAEGYVNVMPDGRFLLPDGAPISPKRAEELKVIHEKQIAAANSAASTNQTRAGVQDLFKTDKDGKDVFDNATGTAAKVGRAWSATTGRPNDYTEARAKIETVQAQALPALMAEMKAAGASPTQLMNTENEAKRVLASRFSIDPDKMSPEQMRKSARDYQEYLSGLKRSLIAQSAGTPATSAAQAQPQGVRLNWTK